MIEPGQIIDKYELLEKVGQGGMAVVYRGRDRSLKREVAIKVLHQHLAEHVEARNRFEREAQAVAKLRHENILEIFDYSGVDSDESYIVTEFIEGQTLKQLITERPPGFPEVGAMITAQVCGALAHAHGLGILHRDIKPENIMIRSDGVLKLMDFGIAQMLDTDRLTVTGQLLGSPAYMSPEHVEGKPLDFRTDVFSVGILLYQLTVGDLPFKGRNPHEILKRIAECEFPEPTAANPHVSRELAGIIKRAMAREKNDRYRDVTAMLRELSEYLERVGLGDIRGELKRYFESPSSYEIALREKLLRTLTARGKELLPESRPKALECFDRVLTLDPNHTEVLALIDRLSRRRRGKRVIALFAGIAALGAIAFVVQDWIEGRFDAAAGPALDAGAVAMALDAAAAAPSDAGMSLAAELPDAGPVEVAIQRPGKHTVHRGGGRPPADRPDAGIARLEAPLRTFTLVLFPPSNAEYRIDDGPWQKYGGKPMSLALDGAREHRLEAKNPCCQTTECRIPKDEPGGPIRITTLFRGGYVKPVCPTEGTRVSVDGRWATLGRGRFVDLSDTTAGTREVEVVFLVGAQQIATKTVEVKYGETETVSCE